MSVAAVQEAPGRRSRWMVDVAHVMGTKGILPFLTETWRQYGDFSQIQIGPRTMHLAVHPEHARHISITNRDNYDKRASYDIVRRLLLGDGWSPAPAISGGANGV